MRVRTGCSAVPSHDPVLVRIVGGFVMHLHVHAWPCNTEINQPTHTILESISPRMPTQSSIDHTHAAPHPSSHLSAYLKPIGRPVGLPSADCMQPGRLAVRRVAQPLIGLPVADWALLGLPLAD